MEQANVVQVRYNLRTRKDAVKRAVAQAPKRSQKKNDAKGTETNPAPAEPQILPGGSEQAQAVAVEDEDTAAFLTK
jgi:hypothetical protein